MSEAEENQTWQEGLTYQNFELGRSLTAKIQIAATQHQIWEKLAAPGYLKNCHPFCASTDIIRWPGEGAQDSITYYSGRKYHRHFVQWIENVGYDIELGEAPNQTCRVLWRIVPLSNGQCEFSITVVPYLRIGLPQDKKQLYQDRLFGADLQHYLECVVKGVDYWVTTGRDVKKNQFGSNPLYSD